MASKIIFDDIACGLENVPVPVVNDINKDDPPFITYLLERRALNLPDENGKSLVDFLRKECETCPGCYCEENCANVSTCSCQLRTANEAEKWATIRNKIKSPFENIPSPIYECNNNCKCNRNLCINRIAQQRINIPLQVFKTLNTGWGVRTAVCLPKNTFIATYTGTILSRSQLKVLEKFRGKSLSECYILSLFNIAEIYKETPEIEWDFCIDASFPVGTKPGGNITRFINHSCDPNLYSKLVFIETHDSRLPHLAFFAKKDINTKEELFWDYAYDAKENPSFNCQCGSEKCRWKNS